MTPMGMDLMNESDAVDDAMEDDMSNGEDCEQEQWKEQLQVEVEQDDEETEADGEIIHVLEAKDLDEKLKEVLPRLTSKDFTIRVQAAKDFRHMLKGDSGGQFLRQYVQASPACIELLEAWKLGLEAQGIAAIFLLIAEILQHPAGKDGSDDFYEEGKHNKSDNYKVLMYVKLRLDKLARTIIRSKMKDVYSQIMSYERRCQNAALLLMAAVVRRGRVLASEVAMSFDFTLKVLPKLAQPTHRKVKQKGHDDDKRPVFFNRHSFIEFAMSFLEVSNPSLLRWVLQIRPLYAGVLRGLGKDDEKTIIYVLTIMQEKVLGTNSMVPPGLRSAVFGEAALEQLSLISADPLTGKAAEIAHDTLMMLCTDPSHGLLPDFSQQWAFSMPSTTLQRGNPARLLRLMLRLRATEVGNHRNLLLAIVNGRTSLASAYMESFPYSLEPRESSAWFAAIALLSDLICAAKVSPPFWSLAAKGLPPPSLDSSVLQSRLKCILPRSFTRMVINRGLLHTNIFVKHGSLRVLLQALSSLECLLNSMLIAVENLPGKEFATDAHKENLSDRESDDHLVGVKGLTGITNLRALIKVPSSNASGLIHAGASVELSRHKWLSLRQEIRDQIRVVLPDPQVLFSLLSSLKTGIIESAGENKKRECPSSLKSGEPKLTARNKKIKCHSIDQSVEICVSEAKAKARKDTIEETVTIDTDHDSDSSDTDDEDMITIAQIWGAKDIIFDIYDCKGKESLLHTKVIDVLALYQRTLPTAFECSFDAFKLLPDEPLLLSSGQQQSLLSLLIDYTGGWGFCALGDEHPGSGTAQIYKYLRPLLKLLLYSPSKEIRNRAYFLAYRALLSTCAFERNKGEVEVWLSFLPGHNRVPVSIKGSEERDSQDGSDGNMFGVLASIVIAFLCDAVSTVGKNLYKYLDELQLLLSKMNSSEDIAPPHFSPLVLCVLEKCLRVVDSGTKNRKLAQCTVIAIYVVNVMNFLLQSQVDSRALAFIIKGVLPSKFRKMCQSDDASDVFLCEWNPLKNLLLFAENILSQEKAGSSLKLMDKQPFYKERTGMSQSLSQVLTIIKVGDCERTSGAAVAIASSIICATPGEILENFPSLVSICLEIFEGDYSVLFALFCAYRELFGQVAEAWPSLFSSGLELASHAFSGMQENGDSQYHKFSLQNSSVDQGLISSVKRPCTTDILSKQPPIVDVFSKESTAVAFACFLKSLPFFALFTLSANSRHSRLLSSTSIKNILEKKISEVSANSYVNTVQIILFWIQQIESSWRAGLELREPLETCFLLLKQLLIHIVDTAWSDHSAPKLSMGLDAASTQEVIKVVLSHPAINMFMSPWICSPFLRNGMELGACGPESSVGQCKKKKSDGTGLENFLHLCQERVHPIDSHILHLLNTLMESASSGQKIGPAGALKQQDYICRTIGEFCRPFIFHSVSVFKNELVESKKANCDGLIPLPTFYILSVLLPFMSPFNLLELVHWVFSNTIWDCQSEETASLDSKLSYVSVGLYFAARGFDMLYAFLNQDKGNADVQKIWDIDGQKIDENVVREVYKGIVDIAMEQNSESADLCLLSVMKAIHVERNARIPTHLLPISIMLSQLTSIIPTEIIKHCICKTNHLKANILLLLTQINTMHLINCGQLIISNMRIDAPFVQLMHLGSALTMKDKMMEENTNAVVSENEYILLLPVVLRYFTSELRRGGVLLLESLEMIAAYYVKLLWKIFTKWDEYTCSDKMFEILECDEWRGDSAEEFNYCFSSSLLGTAVKMLQACLSLEKISKKWRKSLLDSVLPKRDGHLDHLINGIGDSSFRQLLNVVNRVHARASFVRLLLFVKSSSSTLHLERKTHEESENGAPKCSQENVIQPELDEFSTECTDRVRFMKCLICTLDTIFQHYSVHSQTLGVMESTSQSKLISFMEKTLLSHLVDVSREIVANSIDMHFVSSLKGFTKSTLLHRFGDPVAMKALRCLILVLSQENCASNVVGHFAAYALEFLMAHSQFVSTILWTGLISKQYFGSSDKGTMFRSLHSILNLLPSLDQTGTCNKKDRIISSGVQDQSLQEKSIPKHEDDSSILDQRKLEVVKLLRVLYLLKVQQDSSSASVRTTTNSKELLSLLLAGYAATMKESDLEIFSLMHEIEFFEGSSFGGLSEMNYLWGEAALGKRRDQLDEKLLSEYNSVDHEMVLDRRKRQFKENLVIDPKICGETVLDFPLKRSAWNGPIKLSKVWEDNLKDITLEMEDKHGLNDSTVIRYDPAFILQFSIHGLTVGYIEAMDFVHLGLLALAFASISSPDESMRRLGYDVLGRFKQNLENGRFFKGRPQLQLLLTYVKNAVVEPWQKIPSVLAIFAAEASCIMMDPTHNLYTAINRVLMRAPAMVLESIPLFHSMFGSGSVHFRSERIWILRLLAVGLNSTDDAHIYRRKFILEVLMSYYSSSLADFQTKMLVLQVVKKAIKRRTLAQYLVEHAGLLLWLSSIVLKYDKTETNKAITCITLQAIQDLLAWRSITRWLLINGLEQLSQVTSCLLWFLVYDSRLAGEQVTFTKLILGIAVSTVGLSLQRKIYQTHFCLSFEGLFQLILFIEHGAPDMNSRDIVEHGLKTILASSPPPVETTKDKLKLLKLAMWAVSGALQTCSQSTLDAEASSRNHWKSFKDQKSPESLMEKLLRWLAASVILGKISSTANKGQGLFHPERTKLANLFLLVKYSKSSRCPPDMEADLEIDKGLAQLMLYLQQLVGVHCRVLSSVVAAVCLLLFPDITSSIADATSSHHKFISILDLLSCKVSCPAEVNPSWRWSFNSPWRDLSSKISDVQRLREYEICQILVISFQKFLSGISPDFHCFAHKWKSGFVTSPDHMTTELFEELDTIKEEICKILYNGQNIQVPENTVTT